MFSKKSNSDEMLIEMQKNMIKNAAERSTQYEKIKLKALTLIVGAIQDLDDIGLHKEASKFLKVLEKAEKDPVTQVTADQSLKNYRTRGWPFNAVNDSGETSDDTEWKDASDEKEISLKQEMPESNIVVSEDIDETLTPEEKIKLESMW